MPDITSIFARTIYNSRGSKTIETDVTVQGGYTGRVCAPSGASVGKYEAVAFPDGGPEKCVQILADNTSKFSGVDAANAESVHIQNAILVYGIFCVSEFEFLYNL